MTLTGIARDGSGVTGTCTVNVIVAIQSFELPETASVFADKTLQLRPTVVPSNAGSFAPSDFTWKSENPEVATVDENGVVTGVSNGEALITATAFNGMTAQCTVKVSVPIARIEFVAEGTDDPDALVVGLGEDILEKSPFELSGGQKRRVAIGEFKGRFF